jgi:uncharacterized protein (DUF934 family)
MPRRLLRDGRVVVDEWRYAAEIAGGLSSADDTGVDADGSPAHGAGPYGLILTFDQWLTDRPHWLATAGRLGVVLLPAHPVELLAPDLARFELVGAEFPGPSEGRGFTQGRLLRERFGFRGELRATGYVRRDQLFFLARCGFNSFELPDSDLATAAGALSTFSAVYQPSNDAGLAFEPQHR